MFCFVDTQFAGLAVAASEGNKNDEKNIHVNGEQSKGIIHKNDEFTKSLNFSGEKPNTPVLDTVNYPMHMKNLSIQVNLYFLVVLFIRRHYLTNCFFFKVCYQLFKFDLRR